MTEYDTQQRSMAIYQCPECYTRVSVSDPSSLEDTVVQCSCTRQFPRMEHVAGYLDRSEHATDEHV